MIAVTRTKLLHLLQVLSELQIKLVQTIVVALTLISAAQLSARQLRLLDTIQITLTEAEIDQLQTRDQIQRQPLGLMSIKEEIAEAPLIEVKVIPALTQRKLEEISTKICNEHSLTMVIITGVIQPIERTRSLLGQIVIQGAIISILDLQTLEVIAISHLEMQRVQIVLIPHRVAHNLQERSPLELNQREHSRLERSLHAVLNRLEV